MKSMTTKLLQICLIVVLSLTACDKNKVPPISERIQKSYTAVSVTHDNISVYTKAGGSTNIFPAYSNYRLALTADGKVTLRDVTGETFTGTYSVSGATLTLAGLTPQPTGSNGTISYEVTTISDDGKTVTLTSSKANPKTGNSLNVYNLEGV